MAQDAAAVEKWRRLEQRLAWVALATGVISGILWGITAYRDGGQAVIGLIVSVALAAFAVAWLVLGSRVPSGSGGVLFLLAALPVTYAWVTDSTPLTLSAWLLTLVGLAATATMAGRHRRRS